MSRIDEKFKQMRKENRKGFIPFITAGDPDLETTRELIFELAARDATVIELGVPFSDPMADGPIIQLSAQRALSGGDVSLGAVLGLVRETRRRTDVPIVLFGYLNPFLQYGIERLGRDAAAAGVDGFLITDVVGGEFVEMAEKLSAHELDLISLVAPTTNDARLEQIAGAARGFIYAISRAGVTGTRDELSREAERLVGRVRRFSELPVAVGFGVSNAAHVREVWSYADAAVVGSAIVSVIEGSDGGEVVGNVGRFVGRLLATETADGSLAG